MARKTSTIESYCNRVRAEATSHGPGTLALAERFLEGDFDQLLLEADSADIKNLIHNLMVTRRGMIDVGLAEARWTMPEYAVGDLVQTVGLSPKYLNDIPAKITAIRPDGQLVIEYAYKPGKYAQNMRVRLANLRLVAKADQAAETGVPYVAA